MSLARTLLEESHIERELNEFLEHIIKRFSLNKIEVFEAMREYRDNDVTDVLDNHESVVITRKSGRYYATAPDGIMQTISNTQLKSLLKRSSLSFEEYNYLKSFLNTANVPFDDVVESAPAREQLTNVADIISNVEQEIADSKKLDSTPIQTPTPVRASPLVSHSEPKKKLKLKKINKQLAWCENSHYVYRLTTDVNGKDKIDAVIGTRPHREADTQPLTKQQINELDSRGTKHV